VIYFHTTNEDMKIFYWAEHIFAGAFFAVAYYLVFFKTGCDYETYENVAANNNKELFRGIHGVSEHYDLVIVGAGLSGSVIAEQASKQSGLRSLVIERRNHIGGNCFDYIDEHGIRVSKYGAHIFHTKSKRVWDYIHQYSEWIPYQHRVKGLVSNINDTKKIVPVPPNQETVNTLFGTDIRSEEDMENWLSSRRPNLKGQQPSNGEEMSLSRVGTDLYEKIFKHYTKKQWDKYPEELDASVLARLPFRLNNESRYFSDPYEALPKHGYTRFFENILLQDPNIDVRLNVDYFQVKDMLPKHKLLIFTGPIDAFYASQGMEKLEYRSIYFETEYLEPKGGYYQPSWMVNYPDPDVNWTRIAEYKHTPNQPENAISSKGTIIYREYSTDEGDPYYPVPNPRNQELYKKYQKLALVEENVVFVGRLASYKYFNMDQAILTALELYDTLLRNQTLPSKEIKDL